MSWPSFSPSITLKSLLTFLSLCQLSCVLAKPQLQSGEHSFQRNRNLIHFHETHFANFPATILKNWPISFHYCFCANKHQQFINNTKIQLNLVIKNPITLTTSFNFIETPIWQLDLTAWFSTLYLRAFNQGKSLISTKFSAYYVHSIFVDFKSLETCTTNWRNR